jgi:hypothetical protein
MFFRATIRRLFPVACAAVMLCVPAVALVPRAPVSHALDAVTNTVDARGRNTRYALDILGRRARVIYPSGRAESFALDAVVCKYSNALLRLWILGEVGIIGAKTHPEFADMAVWQVARGMKGV